MACRGVPCSNSHSCTQLCSSVPSFLALCLSRFTLQLSHLSLPVTLCFFFLFVLCTQLTPSLSHFHFVSLLPSFVILSLFLLSFFFSHTSTLPLCPLSLFASHKSIFVFFSVSSPLSTLLLSVGSLCWGRHSKEPACHKSYTLGRGVAKDLCTNQANSLMLHCAVKQTESATKGQTLQVDVMQPLGMKTSILQKH